MDCIISQYNTIFTISNFVTNYMNISQTNFLERNFQMTKVDLALEIDQTRAICFIVKNPNHDTFQSRRIRRRM